MLFFGQLILLRERERDGMGKRIFFLFQVKRMQQAFQGFIQNPKFFFLLPLLFQNFGSTFHLGALGNNLISLVKGLALRIIADYNVSFTSLKLACIRKPKALTKRPVCFVSSNSLFHISNILKHISTHFFIHTYIKNTQNTLLKLSYQTGPQELHEDFV